MKDENDDKQKDSGEKDKSWLENLKEEIEGKINNLDTDFPLSGGEEPLTKVNDGSEENTDTGNEEDDDEKDKEGKDKKTSFRKDLDTEFPLSGGEQ